MTIGKVVVLFCGPRTQSNHPSTLRVTKAIQVALAEHLRLFIVGDTFDGADRNFFVSMAIEHKVQEVTPIFVSTSQANTKNYARAIADRLAMEFSELVKYEKTELAITEICLVTDHWHSERASLYLSDAFQTALAENAPTIVPVNVVSGNEPGRLILAKEREGIRTFHEEVGKRKKLSSTNARSM